MALPKDFNAFQETLGDDYPDAKWNVALKALWYDAKGDWHTAHDLVDQSDDFFGKRIHAYLHRKEGDEWNAGYWYRQTGRPFPKVTLKEEFEFLVADILK